MQAVSYAISRHTEGLGSAPILLLKLLQAVGIAALFLTPLAMLLVWPSLPNPFVVAKTIAFRDLVAVAAICAAAYVFGRRAKVSPIVWAFGLLVLVIGIADLAGIDPTTSLRGTSVRLEGYGTPLSYLLYLGSTSSLLDSPALWGRFVAMWALSGLIMAGSGIIQIAGSLAQHIAIPLVWGAAGEHVFLGIYMVFGTLFAVWSADTAKSHAGRTAWLLGAFLCLGILCFAGSRTAIAGLAVGALAVAIGIPKMRMHRWWVVAALVLAFAAANFDNLADRLRQFPVDMASRLTCWHAEKVFISLHPWLGWGQDNLGLVCNVRGTTETWDRAHNLFLQLLVDGGAVALLAWAGFASSIVIALAKIPVRQSAVAVVAIIAYMVALMFEPESIVTAVPFLTFIGWVAWRSMQGEAPHV
jgi:O-antigen ligase